MKLSIVVPVYQVADTLERCLRSLDDLPQDCEVILVDDGSTDGSGALCDAWAARHAPARVLHQPNRGLSAARNAGIGQAVGDYLTFVDSDDFVEQGLYHRLLALLEAHPEYDLVEFSAYEAYGSKEARTLMLDEKIYRDPVDYWLDGCAYRHAYAWNKVFRRSLFASVRFEEGRYFEDVFILPLLARAARVIATTPLGFYYYVLNPRGITQTARGKEWADLLEAHVRACALFASDPRMHASGRQATAYYGHLLNIQVQASLYSPASLRPITYHISLRHSEYRLKALLLRLLGVRGLCRVARAFHALRGAIGLGRQAHPSLTKTTWNIHQDTKT